MKYEDLPDDKKISFNSKKEVIKLACCDCGLVHNFNVDIKEKGVVEIEIKRNNRSTGQYRRRNFKYVRIK